MLLLSLCLVDVTDGSQIRGSDPVGLCGDSCLEIRAALAERARLAGGFEHCARAIWHDADTGRERDCGTAGLAALARATCGDHPLSFRVRLNHHGVSIAVHVTPSLYSVYNHHLQ